jgi:hypothetical protein
MEALLEAMEALLEQVEFQVGIFSLMSEQLILGKMKL